MSSSCLELVSSPTALLAETMGLPIADVLGILSDNLKNRKAVLSLSGKQATAWAKGLDLPHGGETVLYTGHMYQLVPFINAMTTRMAAI